MEKIRQAEVRRVWMNYTETLARWATGIDGFCINDEVLEKAAEFVLDWAGAALAGSAQPPAGMLYGIVRGNAPQSGPCTVPNAHMDRTSELWAAFQNGFNGHVMEMDDVHRKAVFHPGTVIIPAALAIGQNWEWTGASAYVHTSLRGEHKGGLLRLPLHEVHTTGNGDLRASAAAGTCSGSPFADDVALGNAGSQAAGSAVPDDSDEAAASGQGPMNGLLAALAAKKLIYWSEQHTEG